MNYEPYDSSGTDDDLPPTHQNRMSRGGRISSNGRPASLGSAYPRMSDETSMEEKIHQLEQEAYISVLRAFKAQADAITWEKEGLITELRRELRLSNEEHRILLGKVNSDETIQRVREWRLSGGVQPGMHGQVGHDPEQIPSVSSSRKKQKITPFLPSQSFGGLSFQQALVAANQPSSSAGKRGPMMGAKGKRHKTIPPPEGASFDPLIGRRVRTRWPDDNSFYEAVITSHDPVKGLHSLVYDIGTQHETWEWVKLSEISPEDIQWVGDETEVSHRGSYGGPGHELSRPPGRYNGRGSGRERGLTKTQSKDFPSTQNGVGKKGLEDIQLLQTDTLIKEVEKIFNTTPPNTVEMEKAKKLLKEHEQALTEAIAILENFSDGGSDEGGGHFLHGQANRE